MDAQTKNRIISVLNSFETGAKETDYTSIFIYRDGKNGTIRQLTLGRGYTEAGSLWTVFRHHKELGGKQADALLKRKPDANKEILTKDKEYINLIINTAKTDALFRQAEDLTYDEIYWDKGASYFAAKGFTTNLAMAVIQDSYLHSGSILSFLLKKMNEDLPSNGGNEKKWVKEYVTVRKNWLISRGKPLSNTIYRMNFFQTELKKSNWEFSCPLSPANDVKIC